MKIKSIVMAWWSGTRLWPISRKYYPKQFIKVRELWDISLFQQTILRASKISNLSDILITSNSSYKFHALTQAHEVWIKIKEDQILVEPQAKNTLPAIAYAMDNLEKTDLGLILPSDHIIWDEEVFIQTILEAAEVAKKWLVTFGITPFCPHTWYWYIDVDKTTKSPYKVKAFKEKPDEKTAKQFIKDWYFWNAWIFLFSKEVFFSELNKNNNEFYKTFTSEKDVKTLFDKLPDLSIDYGLLEKSDNIYLMPLPIYWNDLGSFDAIDDFLTSKKFKNENIIQIDSSKNFVLSETKNKKVALIWLDDLIVVDTKDALLISKKWETQKIKDIVNLLKKDNSTLAEYWVTVYRPWWSYTIIDEGPWFKSKRITVISGKKLSLQMHYHRSEHWVVVSWTAVVTVWEEVKIVRKGESVYIPSGFKHRLENPGKLELHLIESQIWDYLEEDDIVRFDDDFWRK